MEDRLKNQPRILLINDMASYGKVVSIMILVFLYLKCGILYFSTTLVKYI